MADTAENSINMITKAVKSMTVSVNTTIKALKKLEVQGNKCENIVDIFDDAKDEISATHKAITTMNSAIGGTESKMKQLHKTFDSSTKKANAFIATGSKFTTMQKQMSKVTTAINQSSSAQKKFNTALKQTSQAQAKITSQAMVQPQAAVQAQSGKQTANGPALLDNLKKVYSVVQEPLKKMISMSLNGAMEEQQMKDTFIARTGDKAQGTAIFNNMKNNALASGTDIGSAFKGTSDLMPLVQNVGQLDQLSQMSTRMAAFDSSGGGAEGASSAIKGAMSGDYSALMENYKVPEAMINASSLGDAKDMDSFIKAFDQLLEKANMGDEAFGKMLDSPIKQIATMEGYMKSSFASAGLGAIAALTPLFAMIIEAFQTGQLQPYFDVLNMGLTLAATLFSAVGTAALWLLTTFADYWPVIAGMLLTAATIYLPAMLTALWAMVSPLLAQAGAWLLINWPIVLIIIAVGVLIGILMAFGTTAEQIVGFVTGVFFAFFAHLKNIFALLWNLILAVAEFLVNIFIDPVYAIKKLFFDLVKNVVDFFGGMINTFIDGLNWVLQKVNELTGTKFDIIGDIDTSAIDKFKPTSDKDVFDLSAYQMKQTDLGGEFKKGNEAGKNFAATATDKVGEFKEQLNGGESGFPAPPPGGGAGGGGAGGGGNIDRVGEVGKINETVDISSEDLKTMRELAEMKNIQNFVSLQPSISVQTGDINNGHDIDTIIGRLERSLNDEIASSAEGVYA